MINRYCVFSDKRECTLFPDICKNGATCVELEGSYRCDCTIGWTGPNCGIGKSDSGRQFL